MPGKHLLTTWICVIAAAAITAAGEHHYPVVPAGTEIVVRLQDRIDSESAAAGDTFAALVEEAVEEDGRALIPEGAAAKAELVTTPEIGAGGTKTYAIELQKIQIDGAWYRVTTGYATPEAGVREVPAGEVPQGTTDINKIVGAHGEDSAEITVHGAGVSIQVLQGPAVVVDSDVVLHFTLAEMVSLHPE